ncbi:MAG: hypothetical protein EOP86_00350 [Verrucomicrobiaceae bacterium]|nr:MAG: hypothetical protein EOP86_00350 [Verrucomicrobiaceae bacterium]
MNKRSLSRAAVTLSTACLTALAVTGCDKPAPGLSKAEGTGNATPSVYTNAASTTAVPAAAPAPVTPEVKAAPMLETHAAPVPADASAPEQTSIPAPAPAPAAPAAAEAAPAAPEPAAPEPAAAAAPTTTVAAPAAAPAGPLITIKPVMPTMLFQGTPLPASNRPPNLDISQKPVMEVQVPEGVTLLSKDKPVTSDDKDPIGELSLVTDGDKQGDDGYYVELKLGKTWVQVDLGESKEVWLVWLWHFHKQGVIYRDVIVQVSDDPEFKTSTTVFNNDYDNSAGFGVGKDQSYIETNNGRPVPVPGVKGRYVRFYSNGRDLDDTNQYIEVEVYGK